MGVTVSRIFQSRSGHNFAQHRTAMSQPQLPPASQAEVVNPAAGVPKLHTGSESAGLETYSHSVLPGFS